MSDRLVVSYSFRGVKLVVTSAETMEFIFTRCDPEHRAGRRRKAEYGGRSGDKEEGRVEEEHKNERGEGIK
jgi:hypothetical protein